MDNLQRFIHDPKRFWSVICRLWKGTTTQLAIRLIDPTTNTEVPEEETAEYINSYYCSIGDRLAGAFEQDDPADIQPPAPPLPAPALAPALVLRSPERALPLGPAPVGSPNQGVIQVVPDPSELRQVEQMQMKKMVLKIKEDKSSSISHIKTRVIKDCFKHLPNVPTRIVNSSIATQTVPVQWKVGAIVPLPKAGRSSDVGNWH